MTARRPLKSLILHIVLCAMAVGACGAPQTRDVTTADRRYAGQLVERLAAASPGDIIDIPEGVFAFDRTLVVAADNLILRGQGADRTILSFQDQVMGSQGVRITANRVSLESLAIEDPVGDGVSVLGSDGVGIRGVRVEWTGGRLPTMALTGSRWMRPATSSSKTVLPSEPPWPAFISASRAMSSCAATAPNQSCRHTGRKHDRRRPA